MDAAMTEHLTVTEYEVAGGGTGQAEHSVRELTQKASWHLASLARVIDQIEEATVGDAGGGGAGGGDAGSVVRPRTTPRSGLDPGVEAQLTQREQEVLGLLVRGLSNRRIARSLRISESTVKNHLHAIFLKLDVTDRTQAIAAILGGQRRH
jgi:DNA-binding NarL/FixJ family response regulator